MKQLKIKIIQAFLICAILFFIAESLLEAFLLPYYSISGTAQTIITMAAYIAINLAILSIAAWGFSKIIKKRFEEEIRRQMNERNMLYASITHDLKTPITSILGFSRALKDKKVDYVQQEQDIDIIYQKSKQTDELINILFEYTKLGTEAYRPNVAEVDLCAVLRRVSASHYEDFERKNIEVEVDIPDSRSVILCNEQQIERAFENIVINAYKHNAPGYHVGIFLKEAESRISISIADDGKDITAEEASAILKPFVLGDTSRNSAGGSGLGLAITKKIVELYSGKLLVSHREDKYIKCFEIQFSTSK